METYDITKTYQGKTAGGWLKNAKIVEMNHGGKEISIPICLPLVSLISLSNPALALIMSAQPELQYNRFVTTVDRDDFGYMIMMDASGVVARLEMSDRASAKLDKLIDQMVA